MANEKCPEMTMKPILSLVGVDGNTFSVMGAFNRAAKQQRNIGVDPKEAKAITDWIMANATSYEQAVAVILDNIQEPE